MVGHPFFVDGEAVVVVEGCFDGEVAVAGPSVFLALGGVGGVAHEVGEVGAVGGAAELGDEAVGGVDVSEGGYVAVDEVGGEVLAVQVDGAVGGDFDVAEAFVVEVGGELVLALSAEDEDVGLEGVAVVGGAVVDVDVGEVDASVRVEPFAVFQSEGAAGCAAGADVGDAGHVLAEVEDVGGVVQPVAGAGGDGVDGADGQGLLGGDEGGWGGPGGGRMPR